MEANAFITVTRRRRRNERRKLTKNSVIDTQNYEIDRERLFRTLNSTIVKVTDAPFTKHVLRCFTESLTILNTDSISEIICYGLGRFSEYNSARYQLALLLCLKEQYNAPVHIYDPVFCSEEKEILCSFNLDIIKTNEEGKRVVKDKTTLVYMPHCPKQLTNNFLYANWGNRLSNCILLANSFRGTIDNCLHRNILQSVDYIVRIQPYVTEIQLDNTFEYKEVFNDLNVHIFTKANLLKVPLDFWDIREEPQYLTNCIEFITTTENNNE